MVEFEVDFYQRPLHRVVDVRYFNERILREHRQGHSTVCSFDVIQVRA